MAGLHPGTWMCVSHVLRTLLSKVRDTWVDIRRALFQSFQVETEPDSGQSLVLRSEARRPVTVKNWNCRSRIRSTEQYKYLSSVQPEQVRQKLEICWTYLKWFLIQSAGQIHYLFNIFAEYILWKKSFASSVLLDVALYWSIWHQWQCCQLTLLPPRSFGIVWLCPL